MNVPGDGIDIVIDCGGKNSVDSLQDAFVAAGSADSKALVDQANVQMLDRIRIEIVLLEDGSRWLRVRRHGRMIALVAYSGPSKLPRMRPVDAAHSASESMPSPRKR